MASKYVEELRNAEIKKFDRQKRKQKIKKIFNENGGNIREIRKKYSLSIEDDDLLREIEKETKYENEQGELFLKGFTMKK